MILFLTLEALCMFDSKARDSGYVPVCRDRLKKKSFMLRSLAGDWQTMSRRRMRKGDTRGYYDG